MNEVSDSVPMSTVYPILRTTQENYIQTEENLHVYISFFGS